MLGRASDALRAWAERDHRISAQVADLERRLQEAQELDEQRITTVLGEETARIVAAAREAATEIRSKAEEESARLVAESAAEATARSEELTGEATALRDEARRQRDEAIDAAATIRSDAQEHADRLRADASAERDRLIEAAAVVLEERTAEAEAVAAGIREAAQIELDAARADGAVLRDDARAAAESEVERARAEGRAMVEEARQLRRQMLQDLAERRRAARRQIEAARAGRDRIIESLGGAGDRLAQVVDELLGADDHAQRAADAAADAVADDLDSVVAEFETGLSLGSLVVDDAEPSTGRSGPVEDDDAPREPTSEGPTDGEAAGEGVAPGATGGGTRVGDIDGMPSGSVEPGDDSVANGADVVQPEVRSPGATVHDLFERIRAERGSADPDGRADDEPGSDDDVGSDELIEPDEDGDVDPPADGPADGLASVLVLEPSVAEEAGSDDAGSDEEELTGDSVEVQSAGAPVAAFETGPVALEGGTSGAAVAVAVAATSALDRRDDLLVPIEKALTRTLKRLVSDEQNEVLDRLRRIRRGRPELDALLPSGELAVYTAALGDDFAAAAAAGVAFWNAESGAEAATDHPDRDVLDRDVLDGGLEIRTGEVLDLRRVHLQRALDGAEADGIELAELGDHVRAAYREWRTQSVPQLAGDLATAGFALGEQAAAGPGAMWCWQVDNGGLPCSDAEDNALAGAIGCGSAFPTGDLLPPAHPGCRCILVPPRR